MPSQTHRRKPHHSTESDAALAAKQQGQGSLAPTSHSSPLPTAMSTGRRPKNRRPKKVRWDYPLAVEVQ
jgi:hypothetical protein